MSRQSFLSACQNHSKCFRQLILGYLSRCCFFQNRRLPLENVYIYVYEYTRGWGLSKKGKKQKELLEPSLKTKPARAGWLKRLGLVRAAPWADFAVIGVKLCSSIIAILPCVALSYENCSIFRIIVTADPNRDLRFEF